MTMELYGLWYYFNCEGFISRTKKKFSVIGVFTEFKKWTCLHGIHSLVSENTTFVKPLQVVCRILI